MVHSLRRTCISRDELERALELGFTYADKLHADGLQVVAIGNVGRELS